MSNPVGPSDQPRGHEPTDAGSTQVIAAPTPPPSSGNRPLVLVLVALLGLAVIAAGVLFFTGAFSSKTPTPAAVTPVPAAPIASATAAPVAAGATIRAEQVGFLGPAPFTSPIGGDVLDVPAANPAIGTLASGGLPGLYGGTNEVRCDKSQLVAFLQADTRKTAAFASVLNIGPGDVPVYLNGLAEAVLRSDTAVTTHDYTNGAAVRVPAILQAGTRVLVDDRGIPVVKCQSGSPLALGGQSSSGNVVGQRWTTLNPGAVTVIQAAPQPLSNIQLTNVYNGAVYQVPVSGTAALAKPTGPTATVGQGATKSGCGLPSRAPMTNQGQMQIVNTSSKVIYVVQYGPPLNENFNATLKPQESVNFDTQSGDYFVIRDGQATCLDGVFGPGVATVG